MFAFSRVRRWSTRSVGSANTHAWRVFLTSSGKDASFWHDVPLREPTSGLLNTVVEIPRASRAKIEVDLKSESNPMRQDTVKKTGELRFFKFGEIPFAYGMLPQTYENPDKPDALVGLRGDGDPLDVVFLDFEETHTGMVQPARLVGALALIDEGETDWKLLVVPTSSSIRDVNQLDDATKKSVLHWFQYYKTAEGKPENRFAFDGDFLNAQEAMKVVDECEMEYRALWQSNERGLWLP